MAKQEGSGILTHLMLIAGTAVASVVAVRLFDKHVAPRIGMGPDTKALPPSDEEVEQPRSYPMPAYNPYQNLTPLPPPQMIPFAVPFGMQMPMMPPMPQMGWMQNQQQNPTKRVPLRAVTADVEDEDDDEEDDENIRNFMREVEGD